MQVISALVVAAIMAFITSAAFAGEDISLHDLLERGYEVKAVINDYRGWKVESPRQEIFLQKGVSLYACWEGLVDLATLKTFPATCYNIGAPGSRYSSKR